MTSHSAVDYSWGNYFFLTWPHKPVRERFLVALFWWRDPIRRAAEPLLGPETRQCRPQGLYGPLLCTPHHERPWSVRKESDGWGKKNMLSLQRRHIAFFVSVRVCPLAASGITVQRESFFHRSKDTFWFQHSVALDVLPWKRNSSGWLVATLADEKCWWLISRCVNAITTLVLPHTKPRELHRSISPKTLE